jgi:hypothetical protein
LASTRPSRPPVRAPLLRERAPIAPDRATAPDLEIAT